MLGKTRACDSQVYCWKEFSNHCQIELFLCVHANDIGFEQHGEQMVAETNAAIQV